MANIMKCFAIGSLMLGTARICSIAAGAQTIPSPNDLNTNTTSLEGKLQEKSSAAMAQAEPAGRAKSPDQGVPTNIAAIPPRSGSQASAPNFNHFDEFLEPGQTSTFPGSADSILEDTGGVRSWLADREIGFRAIASMTLVDNLLPTGQPRSPQRYNGQRPTLQLASQNFNFTWRMDRLGLPDTQLIVGMNNTFTGFVANGPNSAYLRNLAIYQKLFGGKVTIKAGLAPNYYEYIGFYVGGSPILASGIAGLLPIQAGLGADPSNVPLVNVTAYGSRGKYIRVGVQRSTSPLGLNEEVRRRQGPFDIDFKMPGAGALYIGEVGIRRPASTDGKQIWLRMGGFYNDSDYTRFDGRGTKSNAALYALADRQITQPDKLMPARGLYLGASAYWVPQSVNTSNLSFEGRAFAIGAIKGRPRDTLALRVTWTKFSDDARQANFARGVHANKDQLNVTTSYSIRAHRGIYAVPGISYIRNPSFIGDFKDAVLASTALVFLF